MRRWIVCMVAAAAAAFAARGNDGRWASRATPRRRPQAPLSRASAPACPARTADIVIFTGILHGCDVQVGMSARRQVGWSAGLRRSQGRQLSGSAGRQLGRSARRQVGKSDDRL